MNQETIYIVEYDKNEKPIYQMTFSGVSAGLSEIEALEETYPNRHYKLQYESMNTPTNGSSIKFPTIEK